MKTAKGIEYRAALYSLNLPEAVLATALHALEQWDYQQASVEYVLIGGPAAGKTLSLSQRHLGDSVIVPIPPEDPWSPRRRALYRYEDDNGLELLYWKTEEYTWADARR